MGGSGEAGPDGEAGYGIGSLTGEAAALPTAACPAMAAATLAGWSNCQGDCGHHCRRWVGRWRCRTRRSWCGSGAGDDRLRRRFASLNPATKRARCARPERGPVSGDRARSRSQSSSRLPAEHPCSARHPNVHGSWRRGQCRRQQLVSIQAGVVMSHRRGRARQCGTAPAVRSCDLPFVNARPRLAHMISTTCRPDMTASGHAAAGLDPLSRHIEPLEARQLLRARV